MAVSHTLLAAQPIYNRSSEMEAVELLYRNDLGESALAVGESRATSELLFNFCTSVSSQADYYGTQVFINVSSDFLLSGVFMPVDPDRVVIELVERIEPTRELIEAVKVWHRKGFRFALDDFDFSDAWRPLLTMSSVIKVDISLMAEAEVSRYREQLDHLPVKWLAEKVEDEATRDRFSDMGFDLFQGYFLAHPRLISGRKLSPGGLHLTRLIGVLYQEDPDIRELTDILSEDPNLALNLIRIVNSPLYRGSGTISSIRELVVRLGLSNLRRWAVLLSSLQAVSSEHARLILVRAHVCEELARRVKTGDIEPSSAFLTGLVSGADVMLGVAPAEFVSQISLGSAITEAVTNRGGALGRLLNTAIGLERAVALQQNLDTLDPRLLMLYEQAGNQVQALFRELKKPG